MRRRYSLLGLLPLLVHHVAAWKHATDAQLREALESSGYSLVAFVLPSENASKELEAPWKAVQAAADGEHALSFDCGSNMATCRELDAWSFPAIRLYHRDGRIDRYRGPRKAKNMMSFVRRSLQPAVFETGNMRGIEAFASQDDVVFVAYVHPDNYLFYERFRALAKTYRDRYSFAVAGSNGGPSMVRCHNNVNEEQHEMTELDQVNALEEFVQYCAAPLVPELTRRNEGEFSLSGKNLVHYFTTTEADKERFRSSVQLLAKQYRDAIQFAITDLNEYPEMRATFGLAPQAKTGLALQDPHSGNIYPYRGSQTITADTVVAFLNDVTDGTVQSLNGNGRGQGEARDKKHDEL
ncbi:Thioredoxin-like fold protein [Niveomyces insectorum RCEF 264]|uniref:protein disulfide-isomerase n=1 Tax=Niveomyces insectorum RCEF 264 TaxID=1081102 RepID=A0A167VPJ0_9HYPO|nr:Thioredoxin-like fold protein [Niveomyces insectorum RCEF 264]